MLKRFVRKFFLSFRDVLEKEATEDFAERDKDAVTDPYRQDAWVANCVDLIARNVGRALFEVRREGVRVTDSAASRLFDEPNEHLSRFEL